MFQGFSADSKDVKVSSTSGVVANTTGNTGNFLADGIRYYFNAKNGTEGGNDLISILASSTATYDLFLDEYGNVLYAKQAEAAELQYLYVLQADKLGIGYEARVAFSDGTISVIRTNALPGADGPIYSYTVKDGIYTLSGVTTGRSTVNPATGKMTVRKGIASTVLTGAADTGSAFVGNSRTTYVVSRDVITNDDDNVDVKTFATYNGFANVPTHEATRWAYANKDGVAVIAFTLGGTLTGETTTQDFVFVTGRGKVASV